MCFQCGDQYNIGNSKQLISLTREVDTVERVSTEVEGPSYINLSIEGDIVTVVQEVDCFNGLAVNNQGVNTILVSGTLKNTSLTLLIDSGSTHNFVDQHTITKAGY